MRTNLSKIVDHNKQPIIIDESNGRRITVNTRVYFYDDRAQLGTVVEITEPEADVDDEGRPEMISPRVYVHWDNKPERETILYGNGWYNAGFGTNYDKKSHTFTCEELVVNLSHEESEKGINPSIKTYQVKLKSFTINAFSTIEALDNAQVAINHAVVEIEHIYPIEGDS